MSADPLFQLSGGLFSSLSGVTAGLLTEQLGTRTGIRKVITARLMSQTTAQGRIHASRYKPLDGDGLADSGPVILVYTGEERVDRENPVSQAPLIQRTYIAVAVEILASPYLPDIDDAFDAIEMAVKQIVLSDETQGGYAVETEFVSATPFRSPAESEYPVASLRLEFECEAHVYAFDQVSGLFSSAHVQWDVGPSPDGQIEAEDDLEFEHDEA